MPDGQVFASPFGSDPIEWVDLGWTDGDALGYPPEDQALPLLAFDGTTDDPVIIVRVHNGHVTVDEIIDGEQRREQRAAARYADILAMVDRGAAPGGQ